MSNTANELQSDWDARLEAMNQRHNDLQADWDARLAELQEARLPVPTIPWGYQLESTKDAEFVVGAIQMVERQIADRRAEAEVACNKLRRLVGFWRRHYLPAVAAVVRREVAASGGKSILMETGVGEKPTRVGFRKSPDRLDITDPAAAIEWAKENLPDAVTYKESVSKTELKNHIVATGELPDGCELVPGDPDAFYGV